MLPLLKSVDSPSTISVPWSLGDATKACLAALAGGIGLAVLLSPLIRFVADDRGTSAVLYALILEAVLLAAAIRFGPWKHGRSLAALGFRRLTSGTAALPYLVLLASLVISYLYVAIVSVAGLESLKPSPLPVDFVDSNIDHVLLFVLVVVLAPLAEESFFRGFLLPALASRWGFLWGAGLTSLLFAITHGDLGIIGPAFITGMLLAWLYYRTRSLWSCIMAHGLQNALAFAVTLVD